SHAAELTQLRTSLQVAAPRGDSARSAAAPVSGAVRRELKRRCGSASCGQARPRAMRVLHVISGLDPALGGPPMALTGLAASQAKAGSTVSVLSTVSELASRSLAGELRKAGVRVDLVGPCRWHFE